MTKIRVLSQATSPTANLEAAWYARQMDMQTGDLTYDGDEVTIMDDTNENMFTMFMKPDGTAMMLQQVVIKYEKQPFITVPNLPNGEPDWQGILDAAGIKGSYSIPLYGPGVGVPTATASVKSKYQRAIINLLAGYSAKEEYLLREGSNW